MKICPISSPYISLCPHVTSLWLINDRGLSAPDHFRPAIIILMKVIPSWSAAQQNTVAPSYFVLSSFLCNIFYEWQQLKKWIHGKSTSSNYWDVSKVKRSKTVSQQLPSLFPLDVWNVASFPALIRAQSTGEAPQVTRAGSLDCRTRLSERDRCVIEDSQPWPTGWARQPGRVWQTTTRSLHENTHSHLFLCSYNNPVERSFIFSLGTLRGNFFSLFICWFQSSPSEMRRVMFSCRKMD